MGCVCVNVWSRFLLSFCHRRARASVLGDTHFGAEFIIDLNMYKLKVSCLKKSTPFSLLPAFSSLPSHFLLIRARKQLRILLLDRASNTRLICSRDIINPSVNQHSTRSESMSLPRPCFGNQIRCTKCDDQIGTYELGTSSITQGPDFQQCD